MLRIFTVGACAVALAACDQANSPSRLSVRIGEADAEARRAYRASKDLESRVDDLESEKEDLESRIDSLETQVSLLEGQRQ